MRFLSSLLLIAFLMPIAAYAQNHIHDAPTEKTLGPGDKGYGHTEWQHRVYQEMYYQANMGPGDTGFMKDEFLSTYQQLYTDGKCNCHEGYCRPTIVRVTQLDAPTGFDVLADGEWYAIPSNALQNEGNFSKELWDKLMEAPAHVCMTPQHVLECVVMQTLG